MHALTFDSFASSLVTSFTMLLVRKYPVLLEGTVACYGDAIWPMVFYFSFYIFVVCFLLNVFVAFILAVFNETKVPARPLLRFSMLPSWLSLSPPLQVTLGINASFLALYTGYSKGTKSYHPRHLLDVLLVRKSLDHTLVELNKEISLSGCGTLIAAFLPPFEAIKKELIDLAVCQLGVHTVYSTYKYYGSKNIPKLSEWWEQVR